MQLEHNFSAATISKAFPLKKLSILYLAFHVLTSYQQLFPCPFLSCTFVSFASSLPLFLFLLLHFSSFPFVYLLASVFLPFRLLSLSSISFFSLIFCFLFFPSLPPALCFPFHSFFSSLHLLASCLSPSNPLFYSLHPFSFIFFLSSFLCHSASDTYSILSLLSSHFLSAFPFASPSLPSSLMSSTYSTYTEHTVGL